MWYVNTTLYNVQSEENCKLYKNLKLEENLLTENNKAVFTDKHEIEQYINDIKIISLRFQKQNILLQ